MVITFFLNGGGVDLLKRMRSYFFFQFQVLVYKTFRYIMISEHHFFNRYTEALSKRNH